MLSPAAAAVPATVPPVPSSASLAGVFLVMACISPKTVQKYRYCVSAQYPTCRRPPRPTPRSSDDRPAAVPGETYGSPAADSGPDPERDRAHRRAADARRDRAELGFKSANAAEEHLQAL